MNLHTCEVEWHLLERKRQEYLVEDSAEQESVEVRLEACEAEAVEWFKVEVSVEVLMDQSVPLSSPLVKVGAVPVV